MWLIWDFSSRVRRHSSVAVTGRAALLPLLVQHVADQHFVHGKAFQQAVAPDDGRHAHPRLQQGLLIGPGAVHRKASFQKVHFMNYLHGAV